MKKPLYVEIHSDNVIPALSWYRVGANENTEIKFYKPVTIGGKNIPAGSYSLFAIPEKDKLTIIINKEL